MVPKGTGVMIQSVVRVIEILDCFMDTPELGVSDIAEKMELSRSTVYGLVNTLAAYGYLEQSDNRRYRLGLKLFELGREVEMRMDMRTEAKPWCKELADKYHSTVHLASFSDGEIIYIDKVDDTGSVVVYSQIGKRAPMYCTGVGKAILANLSTDYVDWYIKSKPLTRKTENTITTRKELLDELELTRERGYAVDDEEIEIGLKCIAAPIYNHDGQPHGAVSISFPFGRMRGLEIDSVAKDVMTYAQLISKRMGYAG